MSLEQPTIVYWYAKQVTSYKNAIFCRFTTNQEAIYAFNGLESNIARFGQAFVTYAFVIFRTMILYLWR